MDEEILGNVVSLNAQRRAEEQAGVTRWLRPEFQAPGEMHVAGEECRFSEH